MAVNYQGPLALTLGLLPAMLAQGRGHIVQISTIGVQTGAPNFAAYVAAKAASDHWVRTLRLELGGRGIDVTTMQVPLVRTPMLAPTRIYEAFPALGVERAARRIGWAVVKRPVRVAPRWTTFLEVMHAVVPGLLQWVFTHGHEGLPPHDGTPAEAHGRPQAGPALLGTAGERDARHLLQLGFVGHVDGRVVGVHPVHDASASTAKPQLLRRTRLRRQRRAEHRSWKSAGAAQRHVDAGDLHVRRPPRRSPLSGPRRKTSVGGRDPIEASPRGRRSPEFELDGVDHVGSLPATRSVRPKPGKPVAVVRELRIRRHHHLDARAAPRGPRPGSTSGRGRQLGVDRAPHRTPARPHRRRGGRWKSAPLLRRRRRPPRSWDRAESKVALLASTRCPATRKSARDTKSLTIPSRLKSAISTGGASVRRIRGRPARCQSHDQDAFDFDRASIGHEPTGELGEVGVAVDQHERPGPARRKGSPVSALKSRPRAPPPSDPTPPLRAVAPRWR